MDWTQATPVPRGDVMCKQRIRNKCASKNHTIRHFSRANLVIAVYQAMLVKRVNVRVAMISVVEMLKYVTIQTRKIQQ